MWFLVVAALSAGAPADESAEAIKLIAKFECARCHDLGSPLRDDKRLVLAEPKRCADCHRRMQGTHDPNFTVAPPVIEHWVMVPRIDGINRHVKASWLEKFLVQPHDLRAQLEESMPRLPITAQEAGVIARFLNVNDDDKHARANSEYWNDHSTLDLGKRVFEVRCASCHTFTGSGVTIESYMPIAPDLRWTRDRLVAPRILQWLEDPTKLDPYTLMPRLDMTQVERLAVTRFILEQPLAPLQKKKAQKAPAAPAAASSSTSKVRWKDVEHLFKPCVHCHDDTTVARGEGGPGNTGGMGFSAAGLELSSYSTVVRGKSHGVSITEPIGGFPPLLIMALERRHDEADAEAMGVVEPMAPSAPRGMPLGLPPMKREDIKKIDAWIAAGMPR